MTAADGAMRAAPRVAYIALGSNLGDRRAHLALARLQLAALPGSHVVAASTVEETAPLGAIPQGPYLNQMIALATTLPPAELLRRLHAIERMAGRERRERWGPRTLDLDIVLIDGVVQSGPGLTLPHPGLPARDFWQRELAELRSHEMHPADDLPPATAPAVELPAWAVVTDARRAHIARVTSLLGDWADAMRLDDAERAAWHDAGRWHDALRDADEATLRALVPGVPHAVEMLHGPAAAVRLAAAGEARADVLDAVRDHTIGSASWARTGRALYMADFLEPGRRFDREERAALAARVPAEFDEVFRTVVRKRIEWALRERKALYPECIAMWNAAR